MEQLILSLKFDRIWGSVFFKNALFSLAVLVGAVLILKLLQAFIKRVLTNRQLSGRFLDERRANTLATILNSVARYVIYFLTALTILDKFNFPVASFLTAAGIGGIALAFGAQNLVRDVITGFFIIFEDQYAVGDHVAVAGATGVVEEMTLRVTKVRDYAGELHIIPNGKIEQVTNFMGNSMRAMVDVSIAYESDLELVERILEGVFQEFLKDFPEIVESPKLLGVQELGDSGIVLRIMARTKALQQWDAERLLRKRIKIAFDQNGIEIPYPRRQIITSAKESEAE